MIPVGYTQANNDLATMQFVMLYGVFWVFLWVPRTWGGKIAAPLFMISVAANMLLDVVYAPLVIARLIADRSRATIAVAVIWLAGVCFQWYPSLSGENKRLSYGHNSPAWIGWQYVSEAIPRALFGEKALGGPGANTKTIGLTLHNYQITPDIHIRLAIIAWGVVLLALVLAATGLTSPNWPLVGTAMLFTLIVMEGSLLVNLPVLEPRYVICPALLLYTALVAALRPRSVTEKPPGWAQDGPGWLARAAGWLPVTAVTVLVAVAIAGNYSVVNGRSTNLPWTSIIATARAECAGHGPKNPPGRWEADPAQNAYFYWHLWYRTTIPCDRVLQQGGQYRVQRPPRPPGATLATGRPTVAHGAAGTRRGGG
jgi:hypothetical protein